MEAKQDRDGQATQGSDEVISIKVEDPNPRLTTSIRQMIRAASPLSRERCIYRAPKRFRQYNDKAFEPLLVSIGPFHHGKENLQSIERLKVAYLEAFLTRGNVSLETCIKLVMEWENSIRNCYAETIEFGSDDFVKMILLDSCFVIEVIWRYRYGNFLEEVTDLLNHPRVIMDVKEDLIILHENQVPFFVLQNLFNLAFSVSQGTDDKHFVNLCINYLSTLLLSGDRKLAWKNISRRKQPLKVKHLLDLFRICQAPSIPRQNPDTAVPSSMWNANKLEEADSSKDVDLLIRKGIIESFSSDSNEVATMFNNLRPYCTFKTYYYYGIQEEVNTYCKIRRHKWRATFVRDYCSSPWMIASTIAAVILLVLTFVQTVCSIISL